DGEHAAMDEAGPAREEEPVQEEEPEEIDGRVEKHARIARLPAGAEKLLGLEVGIVDRLFQLLAQGGRAAVENVAPGDAADRAVDGHAFMHQPVEPVAGLAV